MKVSTITSVQEKFSLFRWVKFCQKKLSVQIFSSNEINVVEITLFCFSFQQQILSFKESHVADLGIFLAQVGNTSEKHLVIFTEKDYGMLSKLVPSIDILQ